MMNLQGYGMLRSWHYRTKSINFPSLTEENRVIREKVTIGKLQIVIEKKRMEIMTYKQHLFFNVISIQI